MKRRYFQASYSRLLQGVVLDSDDTLIPNSSMSTMSVKIWWRSAWCHICQVNAIPRYAKHWYIDTIHSQRMYVMDCHDYLLIWFIFRSLEPSRVPGVASKSSHGIHIEEMSGVFFPNLRPHNLWMMDECLSFFFRWWIWTYIYIINCSIPELKYNPWVVLHYNYNHFYVYQTCIIWILKKYIKVLFHYIYIYIQTHMCIDISYSNASQGAKSRPHPPKPNNYNRW